MIRKTLPIIVAISFLLLTACGGSSKTSLEGTSWRLVSLDGSSPIGTESRSITASFKEGQISGNSGCNSYAGSYALSGSDNLTVSALSMTEMACPDPQGIMDQEQVYLGILGGATGWEIDKGQLYIYDAAGRTLLYDPVQP